jgi:TolB-like protein
MAPTLDSTGRGDSPASPPPAEVRAQLERILDSAPLQASPRRRAFLRYLVEETLAGHADGLKGYSLGLAVFGRGETFDSQSDPVVRLEAGRLRRDLDTYYVDAGARDPVRITIPKGHYVPAFTWHRALTQAPPSGDAEREAGGRAVVGAAGTVPAAAPDGADMAGLGRRGFRLLAGLFAVALLSAAGGLWLWFRGPSPPIEEVRGPSVIVLPFETLSAGEDDRFLASGLTQELIAALMRFDGFRLFSVPTSFSQDAHADPVMLGRDLGVGYVVKGSVSSEAATVRLGAQLVDAETGRVVWSETYDRARTAGALLGVRAELAGSIATVLGQPYGVLSTDMEARLSTGVEPSMASYACVLRAYTYRRTFRDDLRQPVLACLNEAVQRDPEYAEPWAMLGWLHLDAARYAFVPDADVPRELGEALAMASKAVAIDSQNVVALRALSAVQFHLGHFAEAERVQRQALTLNPNDPDTLVQLGWRLAIRGRWDEGLPYIERAIARSINPPGWYYDLITIHLYLEGRYREMLAAAEHSATGDPTGVSLLAIAHGALGNKAAAQEALAKMSEQSPALARDPAAVYRRFQPLDSIVDALVDGLRKAGWTKPSVLAMPQGK